MQEHIYLLTLILPLGTILVIFAMRYGSAVLQARSKLAQADALQEVAEKTASSNAKSADTLANIERAITDVQARLTNIEKVLKDVE